MAGVSWTDDELAYLSDHGIDAYMEAHPGLRTYDAVRIKHGALKRDARYVPGRIGPLRDVRDEVPPSSTDASAMPEPPQVTSVTGVQAGERPDIDEIRRRHEQQFERVTKSVTRKLHQHVYISHGPALVAFVGDQHIGSPGTDIRRMYDEQDMLNATPGAYVVMTGDIVDNYVIGKLMAQNMGHTITIPEEWELARDYGHRWKNLVAVHSGNHAQWSSRLIGVDYDREITPGGVLYDTDELTINLHVGPHTVVVRSRHKWAGNSIHNPTHGLERAAKFDTPDVDVFVGAHVHKGAMAREFIHGGRRKLALMSGTYKASDSYARQEGFPGTDASTAVCLIVNADGSTWATGNLHAAVAYMRSVYRGAA